MSLLLLLSCKHPFHSQKCPGLDDEWHSCPAYRSLWGHWVTMKDVSRRAQSRATWPDPSAPLALCWGQEGSRVMTHWFTSHWLTYVGFVTGQLIQLMTAFSLFSHSKWERKVLVTQWCLALCDPTDCSLSGSSVRGILRARTLEWVDIPFSRGSSWPWDRIWVSHITGRFFLTIWATREAPFLSKTSYLLGCTRS